jgi:hypothetical protein
MKWILALAVSALMSVAVVTPVTAGDAQGEVTEIIVKIETPDGPRWYILGADLSLIDFQIGDIVQFNYADDTIESIEVVEVAPGDPPAQSQ